MTKEHSSFGNIIRRRTMISTIYPICSWTYRLIILMLVTRSCNSDFNIILPEICNNPGSLNLTWIRSMVELGVREEQTQPALNILSPEEICDGSNGLLKFISLAYSDPNGKMIASLQEPLCAAAATFCHLNKKQFISWTCDNSLGSSQMPKVQSLKPGLHDVILAIQRMLDFSQWKSSIALTKSRFDRSPFCGEVGAYLQNEMKKNSNISVMILGNYEDLDQYESMSFTQTLDGLFLCISYDYGFTHNLSLKTGEFKTTRAFGRGIPTVLLLQWPLPVEIFSPGFPTLALLADVHPRIPTTSSFDFQQKSWDPLETSSENILPHKLLETLLAQMILKSVKLSLEMDRKEIEQELSTSQSSSSSSGGGPVSITTKNANHNNFHHLPRHSNGGNGKAPQQQQSEQGHQFLFSVLQFEKSRWFPLVNLVNGEKHFTSKGPTGVNRRSYVRNGVSSSHEVDIDEEYIVTWLQVLLGLVATCFIGIGIAVTAIYTRRKARKRDFSSAKHCRKLSRRHRVPGSCKLLLGMSDLNFQTFVPENPKKGSKSPFIGSFPSFQRNSQEKPDILKGSFSISLRKQSSVTNIKNDGILTGSGVIENTAVYKGDLVYLKKLPSVGSDSLEIKQKAMLVIETIAALRHENLVAMLGCFTPPPFPALLFEYCSRGSLHDIIKQSDIKLDWAFKLSLLTDLVRGMRYLHSSLVRVHGFLTSHNCVIDSRWVLKITDYGLPAFYYTQGLPFPKRSAKELLWTAPELLRDENLRHQGTQAADVYSFAIIMQEILVRGEPYCMLTLTAEEILQKVKRPPPLIRPSVSKGLCPPEAINIMRQCWAELPDMRPDADSIACLFKTLNHGRKANIVDTMFQMLEKYSNNLEELIRERTEQLDLEKKKTEQLLNRMLPNTVAEKLKLGLPVDPEEFSEVTIYFSDIVGFTTISAYSTPFEVVDLLNDLYTCFDATINDYNVYKVETIGDAYMVVGGAPVRTQDHMTEICTMALHLLHCSGQFKIRHLPFTKLMLRIGIHTGPCCGGVVGLTMPRYCLFGDTVNTASRMESTSAPWRIHVSSEVKEKLDIIGGYIIEHRGLTDIKGKGFLPTYWLAGKEGFGLKLPKPKTEECHRLDEDAIKYGRTGVWPESSKKAEMMSLPSTNKAAGIGSQGSPNNITSTTRGLTAAVKTENFSRGESTIILSKSPVPPSIVTAAPDSPNHLAPPKSSSSFAVVSGETMRSLSPAEQIAHQLLNGRPTTKGLRRQLSLDHRVMPVLLKQAQKASIRRAPSLEENLEQNPSTSANGSGNSSSLKINEETENSPIGRRHTTSASCLASTKGNTASTSSTITTCTSKIKISNENSPTPSSAEKVTNAKRGGTGTGITVVHTNQEKESSLSSLIPSHVVDSIAVVSSKESVKIPLTKSESNANANIKSTITNVTTTCTTTKDSSSLKQKYTHSSQQQQNPTNPNPKLHSSSILLSQMKGSDSNIFLVEANSGNLVSSSVPVHSTNKINNTNYVVVDAHSIATSQTGLTVSYPPGSDLNMSSPNIIESSVATVAVTPKLRLNASRAAKLAKILSVVEESSDSPTMDRKYEIVTNQV